VGAGLSASLARLFHKEGMAVALASRHPDQLAGLCGDIGATAYGCDASDPESVDALFSTVDADMGGLVGRMHENVCSGRLLQ
jgi:NAD(P)-dependent dehydrogenase (short-subunit alcohol dehydrogenase family)